MTHIRGPILEETHYYPFGLRMAAISSKALAFGEPVNKYKFNKGTELNSDFDINFYETDCRSFDPQIGRFWQIDELAESSWEWSPYTFAFNNPIEFNDPLGLDPEKSTPNDPKLLQEVVIVAIPKGFWAKQRLYYEIRDQLSQKGATIDQIMQPDLQAMMRNFDGITKHRERAAEMTRESDGIAIEIASFFVPTGCLLKAKYLKYATKVFKLKRGISLVKNFSKLERGLIKEAVKTLDSPQMKTLEKAFKEGVEANVQVRGKIIRYSPEVPWSGITSHGENGFIFGRHAFSSTKELGSTVLHELYRLAKQGTGELGSDVTRQYTDEAYNFAKKAIDFIDL